MPTHAPSSTPDEPFADGGQALHQHGKWVWVPLREMWVETSHKPEELVRQEWVRRLVVDGKFDLAQMDQERRTMHGHNSPRADIVVWESAQAKTQGLSAILIVETKAADGPVILTDFRQGESYARATGAKFLVAATNTAHSVYALSEGIPGQAREINGWPGKADFGDEKRLDALRRSQRTFVREEFQRLLAKCHDLLRDNHAMSPEKAFDTIS